MQTRFSGCEIERNSRVQNLKTNFFSCCVILSVYCRITDASHYEIKMHVLHRNGVFCFGHCTGPQGHEYSKLVWSGGSSRKWTFTEKNNQKHGALGRESSFWITFTILVSVAANEGVNNQGIIVRESLKISLVSQVCVSREDSSVLKLLSFFFYSLHTSRTSCSCFIPNPV